MSQTLAFKDFTHTALKMLRSDKKLLLVIMLYGLVGSVISSFIPLSIQYISNTLVANAFLAPIITISLCLFFILLFYGFLKIMQIFAFAIFEKRFFVRSFKKISSNLLCGDVKTSNASVIYSYAETSNIIESVSIFLFATATLIQQVCVGFVVTSFYNISYFVFNIVLIVVVYFLFKLYLLPSLMLKKRELILKYNIADFFMEIRANKFTKTDTAPWVEKSKHLIDEYVERKDKYCKFLISQDITFFAIYAISHALMLAISGILTLEGYITMPQFVAAEIMFALIFASLSEFTKSFKNIYSMLNSMHMLDTISDTDAPEHMEIYKKLKETHEIKVPRFYSKLAKILLGFVFFVAVGLAVVPWWQTSKGSGKIIAYNQEDRLQNITALVSGRIAKWYVTDGQFVKAGEKLAEIVDNDPDLLEKLNNELLAIKSQFENARLSAQTAKLNFERQKLLYEQGLTARKDFEKANIEYQKALAYQDEIEAKMIQTDVKKTKQQSQTVVAPRDGFVLNTGSKAVSTYIYAGEVLATFVPQIKEPAAEMFVSANDIPLIYPGRKVRLQIEGWPALRISGWPSTSLGTFGGVVKIVDQAMSVNGKFRVVIVPDKTDSPWPDMKFIKQGTNIAGWVNMNRVSIGYEIWRQINGFPIIPGEEFFSKPNKDGSKGGK